MAKYPCPTCDFGSSDPVLLATHRQREHGETVDPNHATLPAGEAPPERRDPATPSGGRLAADQMDRVEWQLNQIRVAAIVIAAVMVLSAIGGGIALALGV